MSLISLVGCNAVGKTTAALRYAQRYPSLLIAECDTEKVLMPTTEGMERAVLREKGWKGTAEEKENLMSGYRHREHVSLIVSARTTHLNFCCLGEPVIMVTCDWQLYEKHMRARCEAKGKRYRDDYWDEYKLKYESSRRYLTFAQKNLQPQDVHHFVINDQATDWPKVDECFRWLYRKLHNQLLDQVR